MLTPSISAGFVISRFFPVGLWATQDVNSLEESPRGKVKFNQFGATDIDADDVKPRDLCQICISVSQEWIYGVSIV